MTANTGQARTRGLAARVGQTGMAAILALSLAGCAGLRERVPTEDVPIDGGKALAAVNSFRTAEGLPKVTTDRRLNAAAVVQSRAMAGAQEMGHNVGGPPPGRIEAQGYHWSAVAENIGEGYKSFDDAMNGWIHSSGHRANLLNKQVTEIGFAAARARSGGRIYWTLILAAPRAEQRVSAGGPFLFLSR